MRNSVLNIEVEVDGGSLIDDAFKDAMKLANKLGVTIRFKFNDVICMATPGCDPEYGISMYHEAIQSKKQFKLAITRL